MTGPAAAGQDQSFLGLSRGSGVCGARRGPRQLTAGGQAPAPSTRVPPAPSMTAGGDLQGAYRLQLRGSRGGSFVLRLPPPDIRKYNYRQLYIVPKAHCFHSCKAFSCWQKRLA